MGGEGHWALGLGPNQWAPGALSWGGPGLRFVLDSPVSSSLSRKGWRAPRAGGPAQALLSARLGMTVTQAVPRPLDTETSL